MGAEPNGGFLIDHDKNIYGTTFAGGDTNCLGDPYVSGCGVVFKLTPTGKNSASYLQRSRRRKSKQRSNFRFQR